MDAQKHGHPRVDQLVVALGPQALRQRVDKVHELAAAIARLRVKGSDLEIGFARGKGFEIVDEGVVVARFVALFEEVADVRCSEGQITGLLQFGDAGSFGGGDFRRGFVLVLIILWSCAVRLFVVLEERWEEKWSFFWGLGRFFWFVSLL